MIEGGMEAGARSAGMNILMDLWMITVAGPCLAIAMTLEMVMQMAGEQPVMRIRAIYQDRTNPCALAALQAGVALGTPVVLKPGASALLVLHYRRKVDSMDDLLWEVY